jgi:hypothetical protein
MCYVGLGQEIERDVAIHNRDILPTEAAAIFFDRTWGDLSFPH